ncbi:hypothetical protein FNV43_RR27086 [Rhamnella rubrinervis]|uniref:Exocyst subunit Exo70 family protein n=1 Tax=Rhamnella rubrinervis TaxID=2594499 RepID=A0A8K0DPA5_9ROSA|nr:hypothetical protein FNV43_RR27086 [Rhamnella rubrinervis]
MMEKNHPPKKSRSFGRNISDAASSDQGSHHSVEANDKDTEKDASSWDSLPQVLQEVDRFLDTLSTAAGEDEESNTSPPSEVPNSVELLSKMVESMISKYNAVKNSMRFGKDPEKDSSFLNALKRISGLSRKLGEFPSNPSMASTLNRTSSILQKAMSFLDEEFRLLLDDTKANRESDEKIQKPTKQSSFNNLNNLESDRCLLEDRTNNNESSQEEDEYPGFSPETISNMNKIATAMISAGYETECCMAFSISRRTAFRSALDKLGYDHLSIDDIHKMSWESLEGEIATWITVVKQCSSVLFVGERKLCDTIFSSNRTMSRSLFSNLARAVAIQILNFAEAVVLTKRAAEKLFKILDMYETLRDLIPAISESYPEGEVSNELFSEATAAKSRLGEVAVSIFCELENSIKNDIGKTPVASGAVHPLTRYVVNYLKYACDLYKDTLEQAFQLHLKMADKPKEDVAEDQKARGKDDKEDGTTKTSPFQAQLMSVMELLDSNIEMKSKLYRDPSLRCIFMMNNGRYILQKIKGSTEIHQLMGNTWCRKRSSGLRLYHKNYQRETWSKVLQCLSHEGLQVNGKISKPVLKERFKSFNTMFEEIHKTQSSWVVSDEQLQSELRVSVSAVMIPAYRSFLGRFKQYLDPGRQAEKYIKYQPEDIENMIEDLFDGNATSMARRR